MNKLQLKIGGLSCSFCAESIRKAYRRIDAVKDVNVSLGFDLRGTEKVYAQLSSRFN